MQIILTHDLSNMSVDSQSSRFTVIQGSFLRQLEKKNSPVDTENYLGYLTDSLCGWI